MSSQYPPPPTDETQNFPLYTAASSAPLLESQPLAHAAHHQQQQHSPHAHQHAAPQLQYSPQTQSLYPKLESLNDVAVNVNVSHHVLQQQAHQATHALTDQRNGGHPQHDPQQPLPIPHHHQPLPHLQAQQHALAHPHQRPNRLRKACDSCSIRKVKCDESGPPCRACLALEIPCTFDRPKAIKKKRRLDGTDAGSGASTPASPTNAAHALAQLSSHSPQLSAESICSVVTMNALIDDFFTHIHPLCPFPHEPSFREAWERREDYTNPSFLALLASMIACLVASFPRKPRLHLKAQKRDQYPSHLALVDKCREVCAQARGPGYLDSPTLNVYDACASYFLGLAGAYTFNWRQLRLYFGECLTILRALGLHKAKEQGYTVLGGLPGAFGSNGAGFEGSKEVKVDHIMEQISRRLFWTLFVGVRTMQQLGASFSELYIPPSTPSEPLPPLPLEVDDSHIYPNQILPQPAHIVPLITGFNINVRIYTSYSTLSTAEMAYGSDELFDWPRQQKTLEQCLHRCKQVLLDIPDVLRVQPAPPPQQESPHGGNPNLNAGASGRFGQRKEKQPYYPPMPEYINVRDPTMEVLGLGDPVEARRGAQYEIQKANIYATHLSIRSYLVEKYFTLLEKWEAQQGSGQEGGGVEQQGMIGEPEQDLLVSGLDRLMGEGMQTEAQRLEQEMEAEREAVVRDLLVVLGGIEVVNMEPNGDSFTQKIRQIASTLLKPRKGDNRVTAQNQEYLSKFLDILSRLERVSDGTERDGAPMDEEEELRSWADLREYQLRFQELGGIYGFV